MGINELSILPEEHLWDQALMLDEKESLAMEVIGTPKSNDFFETITLYVLKLQSQNKA